MDTKLIGKWSYIIGLAVVILAALAGYSAGWLGLVLVILAILVGLFYVEADNMMGLGINFLVLTIVGAALDAVPYVGPYITGIVQAMLGFFAPILLTALLVIIFKHLFKAIKG